MMPIDSPTAAGALLDTWVRLGEASSGAWMHREDGALATVTGVMMPTLNGVWVERVDTDLGVVAELLRRVSRTTLPHCLQVRPAYAARVSGLAAARGMTRVEDVPLMVREAPAVTEAATPSPLRLRELDASEAPLHARLAAAGFEAPAEPFLQLITPELLAAPGVRCYVGEVGGQCVTTGIGVTFDDHVGVFDIATLPAYRRRGYGAAVTVRAVQDGLAAGATWAWLQSSDAGLHLYETLGFRTTENWSCWLSVDEN